MIKCLLCHKQAAWKDKIPLKKRGHEHHLYYCESHYKQGLMFGWLEKEDMVRL